MYQNIGGTPEGIWLLKTSNRALRVLELEATEVDKHDAKEAPSWRWAGLASPTRHCAICGAAKAAEMLDRYDQGDKCLTNLTPKLVFLESRATENILRVAERVEGGLFSGKELDKVKERVLGRSRGHSLWSRQSPTFQERMNYLGVFAPVTAIAALPVIRHW